MIGSAQGAVVLNNYAAGKCKSDAYALGRGEPMGKWVELADAFIRQLRAKPLDYDKAEVRRRSEERRRNFKPNKH